MEVSLSVELLLLLAMSEHQLVTGILLLLDQISPRSFKVEFRNPMALLPAFLTNTLLEFPSVQNILTSELLVLLNSTMNIQELLREASNKLSLKVRVKNAPQIATTLRRDHSCTNIE